jgi:CRISPR-associated endoribonuclease Cas6
MRVQVRLRAPPPIILPLSQVYPLAALIYRLLDHASSAYAAFLHRQGYGHGDRRFKLFTFSPLLGGPRRVVEGQLRVEAGTVSWYVSSPVEAFLRHLIEGLLSAGAVDLGGMRFDIVQTEVLPEPAFSSPMRFTCLSPITMSVRAIGQRWAQYLTPEDPRFAAAIRANLERKHVLVRRLSGHTTAPLQDQSFSLTFDPAYVARHEGRISKLIDYKGTKIRGYLAPFTVTGPAELLWIGYQCGFGDKNSQGFGMVEVAQSRDHTAPVDEKSTGSG